MRMRIVEIEYMDMNMDIGCIWNWIGYEYIGSIRFILSQWIGELCEWVYVFCVQHNGSIAQFQIDLGEELWLWHFSLQFNYWKPNNQMIHVYTRQMARMEREWRRKRERKWVEHSAAAHWTYRTEKKTNFKSPFSFHFSSSICLESSSFWWKQLSYR